MWRLLLRCMMAPIVLLLAFSTGPRLDARAPDRAAIVAQFETDAQGQSGARRRLGATRGISLADERAPGIDDVAALLARRDRFDPNTALLFYAQTEAGLNIYLVGDRLLEAETAQKTPADVGWLALQLRAALGVDDVVRSRAPRKRGEVLASEEIDSPPDPGPAIRRLSAMLIPGRIGKAIGRLRHLVIVGNGEIGAIPFSLLRLPDGRLLVEQASVTFAPGLADIARPVAPWDGAAAFAQALVVGNPDTPDVPGWIVPPLAGAETEAKTLANRIGIEPLIGRAATKAAIIAAARHASLIYVAAHGIADPDDPLARGYLMLAGDAPATANWTAGEIQTMRLDASLAVLSACQSGLGRRHDGGTIGLARAFQLAGVPRVVMSLWSVGDESTAFLMDRFNRHALSKNPAEALRLAMLDTRKVYRDPALWAPFALFGTPR